MPNWRTLDRGRRWAAAQPNVGIQATKGTISLNRAAFEALGAPQAVEVLCDPEARLIGFRATSPASGACPVHQQGRSATYLIAGKALVRAMAIDTSHARRYDAELVDDVLTVDLTQAGVRVSAGAPRRNQHHQTGTCTAARSGTGKRRNQEVEGSNGQRTA